MQIREVLMVKSQDLHSVTPETPVSAAVELMARHDIGSLLVMENGEMAGLVTERDILKMLSSQGCALLEGPVSLVMATEPIIASPDDSIDYARDVMTKFRISHLPVLEGNKLTGVISFHDVAKACLREAKFENHLLKRYIKHWPE
jgi:CBS domain-containing protein